MKIQQFSKDYELDLRKEEDCLKFLKELVKIIGIHPVAYNIQLYPTPDKRGGYGITATVYFVESYATLDSWPEKKYVHLNIISCKKFDEYKIMEFVKNWKKETS